MSGEASSSKDKRQSKIANLKYRGVPGLCKAATIKEIEAQGWSHNPGRYVGVAAGEAVSDEDFKEQLETLNELDKENPSGNVQDKTGRQGIGT